MPCRKLTPEEFNNPPPGGWGTAYDTIEQCRWEGTIIQTGTDELPPPECEFFWVGGYFAGGGWGYEYVADSRPDASAACFQQVGTIAGQPLYQVLLPDGNGNNPNIWFYYDEHFRASGCTMDPAPHWVLIRNFDPRTFTEENKEQGCFYSEAYYGTDCNDGSWSEGDSFPVGQQGEYSYWCQGGGLIYMGGCF